MRTIKFRGKCCHCDAWAYGNLVDYGEDELPEIQGFDVFGEGSDVCISYKNEYGHEDIEYDFIKAGNMLIEVIENIHDNPKLLENDTN